MDKEWQPMNFGSILDSIETRYYAPGDPRLLLQQNERTTRPKSREELVLPPLVQQPWQKHLNARGGSIAVNRQKIEQMNKRNEQESTCSYKVAAASASHHVVLDYLTRLCHALFYLMPLCSL